LKFTFPIGFSGVLFLLFFCFTARAQEHDHASYFPLQFTENKGQWDKDVLYRTDLGSASVFLKKNSFTFLVLNKDDMDKLQNYIHPRSTTTKPPHVEYGKNAGKQTVAAATGDAAPSQPGSLPDVRAHAYNVTFVNASSALEIVPEKPQEGYANYLIGNDSTKWKGGVKSYQRINYKHLYPGIDALVYSEAAQLKYDLIVHPGSNPGDIQLAYEGATGIELKKGQLYIRTSAGEVIEQMPFAYQYINNQRVTVKVSYELKGNKVGFKVSGKYDNKYPLVIDPTYVFSTVSGSVGDNWGFTATYDAEGSFYGGGIVFSPGYPTTPGAVQSAFGGGTFDIGISKFSSNGRTLIYATYIGGNGRDQPHSLFVDASGNLVISGRTNSSNYPSTKRIGPGGGWDMVVTKLNATGTAIIGSLIIGGSGDDGVNMSEERAGPARVLARNYGDDARSEVVIDNAGYIYVASSTRSANFPVTSGVFQSSFGGSQDGVVVKINVSCNDVVWASYLGGSREDAAYVIALNGLNTLYVAGGTASTDFKTTSGALYPNYRGGVCDGYIAHISNDGSSILQCTYLGAENMAADQVYGIQLDTRGYVYVMGTTEGTWPTLQPPGTATFYNDKSRQFISKLAPDLSKFIYSTTFGKQDGNPSLSPVAFLVDRCENVYVSGWGGGINIEAKYPNSGVSGLPVTRDALQSATDGADFYFFVLRRDATEILFASYFGGYGLSEHVDGGTSRFDRNGVIYQGICAWCGPNPKPRYPTTPGAYSSKPPAGCNMGALKIAFNLDGVKAGAKTQDRRKNYCVPATITFLDTTNLPAETWKWVFENGAEQTVTTLDPVTHTFNTVGDYKVMLVKTDSRSCNGSDTTYVEVRVRHDEAKFDFTGLRQQPCEDRAYLFELKDTSSPAGKPFGPKSFVFDPGDGTAPDSVGPDKFPYKHLYSDDGIYNATLTLVDTNYCNAPQTITLPLRVAINVVASFTMPDSVCVPAAIQLINDSKGGERFEWVFEDDGTISNEVSPLHHFTTVGKHAVTLKAFDDNTCNKEHDTTMYILVSSPPVAEFTFSPNKPQENTPTQFTNLSRDAVHYAWQFGDGDTSSLREPTHQYLKTGNYNVCLTVINAFGCDSTVCQQVSALVNPLFDIPTAFSPNNDGINDFFEIKGFGIIRYNMKIFNRWGQMMFESNSPRVSWDGRYKGAIQPMDAYAYVVNIEFSDGTTANKSGSVTLLR
jgi:gliding motility-associated-like protein